MNYKNLLRVILLTILVVASYFVGEWKGIEKGVAIASVYSQSGRSADTANMAALLLGFSRRGQQEKMYEFGESILIKDLDTYNQIQNSLPDNLKEIYGSKTQETLSVMIDSPIFSTTTEYVGTYIESE